MKKLQSLLRETQKAKTVKIATILCAAVVLVGSPALASPTIDGRFDPGARGTPKIFSSRSKSREAKRLATFPPTAVSCGCTRTLPAATFR